MNEERVPIVPKVNMDCGVSNRTSANRATRPLGGTVVAYDFADNVARGHVKPRGKACGCGLTTWQARGLDAPSAKDLAQCWPTVDLRLVELKSLGMRSAQRPPLVR